MVLRSFAALLLAAAPAAAAEPANEAQAGLAALQADDARVASIGYRLAVAARPWCPGEAVALPGFTVHALKQYEPEFRADAAALFGLGDAPAVLAVAAASAADKAGLRPGDSILAIDGAAPPPESEGRKARFGRVAQVEAMIEQALADDLLVLQVERGGAAQTISIRGEAGCPTRFQVAPSADLNAAADGRYVKLSTALIAFAQSDDELALAAAHEFAHNILKHRERLDAQGVSRGLFRAFGKNPGRIRATENEADRLALRLMDAAGFDIAVAPGFWVRFGAETDAGLFSDRTHAGRKERVRIAEEEIAAIRAGRR